MAVAGVGCTHGRPGNTVTGRITPEHFQFTTTVKPPRQKEEDGGWRAVCIHAQTTMGDSGATTVCKFEVGVPIRTSSQGEIPLEDAQDAAADMANRAAFRVLSEAHPGDMLAELCIRFKVTYEFMLREKIKGSRIGECRSLGIKTVPFGVVIDPAAIPPAK
ncbi:hypothetical protein [Hyalangium sp.]|uniref:hypothetical protein n=1 Tax=Hyalangium sp. TaxID=2028555 RepID=UPI002D77EF9D|nr:hypothetical protein [Hyalangium sp.]